MRTAGERDGMYLVNALCMRAGYLTVSRPDEMRQVTRQAFLAEGMKIAVGKRKKERAEKFQLIEWSTELRAVSTRHLPAAHDQPVCFQTQRRPALYDQQMEHEPSPADGACREEASSSRASC